MKPNMKRLLAAMAAAGTLAAAIPSSAALAAGDASITASSRYTNGSIAAQWAYGESAEAGSVQPITAEPKVERPSTTPCTVNLFDDYQFIPKDGAPPQDYSYTPPADCKGPWAKVVLETDFRADADAALYDKTAQMFLGGVTVYYGTTMGPGQFAGNYPNAAEGLQKVEPEWHEENDLTEYSALFTQAQSGKVHIDNDAMQGPYKTPESETKAVHMSARLKFYPLAEGETAPEVADDVRSLDPATDEGKVVWNDSQELAYTFDDLPRNIENVYLDVTREGQRSDEFYYLNDDPKDNLREFIVKIDGTPAGVVPAYPYKYTYTNGGGYSYYHWSPAPGPNTFNFIAYRVDLSPFAGVLSDGGSHTVSVNGYGLQDREPDRDGYVLTGGSFWYLAGNLVMYRDHGSEQVTGEVTSNTLAAEPTVTEDQAAMTVSSTHDSTISGYVNTSHGKVTTTLDSSVTFSSATPDVQGSTPSIDQTTGITTTKTVTAGDKTATTKVDLQYINQTGPARADGTNTLGWTYNAQDATGWTKISDLYTTVPGSSEANARYTASDSTGRCYDRSIDTHVERRNSSVIAVTDGGSCPVTEGTANLEAEVIAPAEPEDGEFSFVAPAEATVRLTANAELDDLGRSVSTGTLGAFSVIDQRAKTKPGWDLTADATDFTRDGGTATTFGSKALGIHVKTAAKNGLTIADTTAGSATYATTIASLGGGRYGDTAFDGADLTVIAPAGTPAGTYGSTLTLTLTSK
ncbi:peptide-N4-asparagine amidase [Bifidobacterium leontopitheci]|uniref:Peptide-N(4)-(N-acetyl-beta-glucosaminyl)asparag ine amidase n=1 Tax=Bifidobacterium leontopitheci TaxID=2650774 RepID=A0A6I1GFR2_9BIFI|nr:peptide-N4-asparagine amidase [Bifidobacterium leontopitheci]KAB7790464.1 peptide-N(4)-(N-acetyl-beta- glucosaminyl)asparag ine amidase [Bifidobacterium leontopitheci]